MKAKLQTVCSGHTLASAGIRSNSPHDSTREAESLADLPTTYVFGLASRGVHLIHRSLWPSTFSVGAVATAIALTLSRPIAVLAPLVIKPVRAALVFVLTLLAASALSETTDSVGPTRMSAIAGFALAAYLFAAVTRPHDDRWGRVNAAWERLGIGPELVDIKTARRAFDTRVARVKVFCAALIAGAALVMALAWDGDLLGARELNTPGAVGLIGSMLGLTVVLTRSPEPSSPAPSQKPWREGRLGIGSGGDRRHDHAGHH